MERCVPKVSELRARFPEKDIEVDGGVGPKTIDVCADAGEWLLNDRILPQIAHLVPGSNVIVAGTAIFAAPNPEGVIALLKETVTRAQARIAAANN